MSDDPFTAPKGPYGQTDQPLQGYDELIAPKTGMEDPATAPKSDPYTAPKTGPSIHDSLIDASFPGAGALQNSITKSGPPDVKSWEGTVDAGGMNKLPENQRMPLEELGQDPPTPWNDKREDRGTVHEALIEARLNGHSWDAIRDHMTAHYDAGGTREQLGFAPQAGLMERLGAQHAQNIQVALNSRDEGVGTMTTLAEHGTVGKTPKVPFNRPVEPSTIEPLPESEKLEFTDTPSVKGSIEEMEGTKKVFSPSRDREI
jgi:hypothetical protein